MEGAVGGRAGKGREGTGRAGTGRAGTGWCSEDWVLGCGATEVECLSHLLRNRIWIKLVRDSRVMLIMEFMVILTVLVM